MSLFMQLWPRSWKGGACVARFCRIMQFPKQCFLLLVVTLLLWAIINLALFCDLQTTAESPVDGVTPAAPPPEGGTQHGAAQGDGEGGVEGIAG